MNAILKLVALLVHNNAVSGAGAASLRGMHETNIPAELKKNN